MVRFRKLGLDPDFDDATRPELNPIPTPRWFEYRIQQLMHRQSFPIRYLVEALLTHGRVSFPELAELFAVLSRVPASRRQLVLEGLFTWTRQGAIKEDLVGKLMRFAGEDASHSLYRGRSPHTAPTTIGHTSSVDKALLDHPDQVYTHATRA